MTKQRKIAAIIVVYQPPKGLDQLLSSIKKQVDEVIIVNNGQNEPAKNCHWIENPTNGLAKAQNLGIAKARELECDYVLLLDDDSEPLEGMVASLIAAHKKLKKQGKEIAVLGPYLHEDALDEEPKYITPKGKFNFQRVTFSKELRILEDLYYVAASGSLIPLEVFDNIGEMKEEFFIYYVDTEFCLRARKAGFDIVAVQQAKMKHRFGERSNHSLLGRKISTTNHSPKAREYMFRNRRHLWAKYFDSDAGYVWFDLLRAQSEVLRVLLFEKDKLAKCRAMARGLLSRG